MLKLVSFKWINFLKKTKKILVIERIGILNWADIWEKVNNDKSLTIICK